MSVQTVSRIAALLALDADMAKNYVPRYADDDYDEEDDLNEQNRANLAASYNDLTSEEVDLIADGDMNANLAYIATHLDGKPVDGEDPSGG